MSTPAEAVSPEQLEMARNLAATNDSELARALKRVTQVRAAACIGISESSMSRQLDKLRDAAFHQTLAAFGLQLVEAGVKTVPAGSIVVDAHEQHALESMVLKYLEARRQQRLKEGL